MGGGPATGYQDQMFAKRMGSEKPGPEVLQDAFFGKERPNRNKEGRKVHWKPALPFMMIALLSFLQMDKGTLPT